MELRQLKTFLTIAETLNFTKAADRLGYAQSSVTTQIKLLEEELGVRLFERLGKNVFLTEQGATFEVYAKQLLQLESEAKDALIAGDALRGAISIGSVESLCATRFPRIYKKFHERFPQVEVTIKISSTEEIKAWLRSNVIDIGFFLDARMQNADLVNDLELTEPMSVLASSLHPLTRRIGVCPEELHGEALILTESDCSYRQLFEQTLKNAGAVPRSILESGNIQSIKQLTISGMGISFLPTIAVAAELEKGELAALDWGGPAFVMMTQITYHRDKNLTPAMKAFLEIAKADLTEGEGERIS